MLEFVHLCFGFHCCILQKERSCMPLRFSWINLLPWPSSSQYLFLWVIQFCSLPKLTRGKQRLYVLTIAARVVSRVICHNKTQSCREVSVCSQSAWKSVPVRHVTGHSNENKLFVIFVIIFYSLHFAPLFRRSVILHRGYPQV